MDAEQAIDSSTAPTLSDKPVIEVSRLRRVYRMGEHEVHALKDVDLRICEGEFVAIIGPSGSGKSTLMYLLGCLDTPSAGSYKLAGREVAQMGDLELSQYRNRHIGFIFQAYHLLPELTVTQNVALGLTYDGVDVERRQGVAHRLADALGLGDRLGHTAMELSGGQMQRVAIARALAVRPNLILADEPTGNLDSKTGKDIMALLRRLHADGHTIVLVTHDPKVAAQADRILTIVDGDMVSDESNEPVIEQEAADSDITTALPTDADLGSNRGGGIRKLDLARMALREGILAHKLRSFLTMLGIVFGIAAVIAMTAITEGGKQQQLEQIRQIGLNNIQIGDLGLEGARLLRVRRQNPDGVTRGDLADLLRHVDGIEAATAWRGLKAELRAGDQVVEDANILGTTGAFEDVVNYFIGHGRFLDAQDEASFARVCVLGPAIAEELGLGSGDSPLGQVIILGDQPFTVVGLMRHKRFTESAIGDVSIVDRNRDCYIPLATLDQFFRKDSRASELDVISLRMASEDDLLDASLLIHRIIDDRHNQAEDFAVSVPLEKLRQAQQTKEVFNVIITVIAAISLIVGGIGIMNIMLATVTERTKEIGIRRAIGASRQDILRQFLGESLLIASCGGLLGIVMGLFGAIAIEQGFGFAVAFNGVIIAVSAGVSVAVGIVFGLYPAWKAAHMDPVVALRT